MKKYSRSLGMMIIALSLATLFACNLRADHPAKISIESDSQDKRREEKPGAPIRLVSDKLLRINPAEKSTLNIVLSANDGAESLWVEFLPSPGLQLLAPLEPQAVAVGANKLVSLPVVLLANVSGRYYLNIHIGSDAEGLSNVRNLAVIIQVGDEPAAAIERQKSAGDNVITMPAQETIKTSH